MAEIERKFLTRGLPDGESAASGVAIDQGYLVVEDRLEIRLRRAGDDFTLTMKHGHGEIRGETELPVSGGQFDELWPLTEGRRVEKTRHRVDLGAGLVAEVDLYRGDLDELAVVEVEFGSVERAEGFDPPRWFGRELTGDRAWANQSLARSGRPKRKLEFRLRPAEEPGSGLARVIAARSAQAAASVREAAGEEDPGVQVHGARKSLKKARSALRLLRGAISDDERRRAGGILRAAGAEMSGARDAEVKIATLEAVSGSDGPGAGLEGTVEMLESEAATHRNLLTASGLARSAAAIDTVRRSFADRDIEVDPEVIAGNLGRTYRRGRRAMKDAEASGNAGDFHAWRKRVKDLRYQLEILETELPSGYGKLRKEAKELAELLGDTHDLDVLGEDLEGRDLDPATRREIEKLVADRRGEIAGEAIRLGQGIYSFKPRKFTRGVLDDFDPVSGKAG